MMDLGTQVHVLVIPIKFRLIIANFFGLLIAAKRLASSKLVSDKFMQPD